ncbi:hypothetical protein Tco_0614473, partial [Tanacetum coccineum]
VTGFKSTKQEHAKIVRGLTSEPNLPWVGMTLSGRGFSCLDSDTNVARRRACECNRTSYIGLATYDYAHKETRKADEYMLLEQLLGFYKRVVKLPPLRSWEFFFEQLCSSYDVEKYIHSPTNEATSSTLPPLTPEELKVDKIVLLWIFTTLLDALQARLVVARPKSAKEAWSLLSDIVKDNKRSRTYTLKAELRSIKLGDQKHGILLSKDRIDCYHPYEP